MTAMKGKIAYMDRVRVIRNEKTDGKFDGKVGTVISKYNHGLRGDIIVEFDDGETSYLITTDDIELVSNIRDTSDIEEIWDEDMQPISEAELRTGLHEPVEDASVDRNIYIIAIAEDSRNQADGWDCNDEDVECYDPQPWQRYYTEIWFICNNRLEYATSDKIGSCIYSDTHDINTSCRGRSVYTIRQWVKEDSLMREIRELYGRIGLL